MPPACLRHGIAFAALVFLGAAVVPTRAIAAAPERPNIVLIISDDQGWGDYSFMGHPHIRTPNLDKLAAQSLTFPRGYATSSVCCPSLASILTSLYPHQNKITSNDPPKPPGKQPAELRTDPDYQRLRRQMIDCITRVPTLPGLLKERGYVSLQTGKWWQGSFRTGGFTHGMTHGDPARGGRHGDAGLAIGRETMQPIYDFVTQAQQENHPFFVWYAPMLPHQPHNPPQRLLARYKDKTPSAFVARYWAMVDWFDETCGQLLDFLDRKGLTDNTIVVYVTDNGWIQDPKANAPVRSKLTQYDAGHRTPILIRWPGKVKPEQSRQLADAVDLAPTLLHAVGLKPTADMQGVNLLDAAAVARRPALFGECFTHDAVDVNDPASSLRYRWVIAGDWKLIVPHARHVPRGGIELYHLADDPTEEKDRAAQEPGKVEVLQKMLDAWWTPGS
jgi:uncharacterized sulfatase